MATFYNQATLSYNDTVTNSNVTTGELIEALEAEKNAISTSYRIGESVAYAISIVNSSASPISNITVTDNLGAISEAGSATVYPLDYIDGTLRFYVNGALTATPTVTSGAPLVISGITIPAGANAIIIYEARVNSAAPGAAGSVITNTAVISGDTLGENITVSSSIPVRDEASLTIAKAICPDTVTDNSEITYTFIIQNSGNAEADASANVSVSDTFNPVLTNISVSIDGDPLPTTAYTYDETSGVFATVPGQITVPGATYSVNPTTGDQVITPGVAILKIVGTV